MMVIVDMQTCRDGEFNFILNYQDHVSTKFVQLKLSKTKISQEAAFHLLNTF